LQHALRRKGRLSAKEESRIDHVEVALGLVNEPRLLLGPTSEVSKREAPRLQHQVRTTRNCVTVACCRPEKTSMALDSPAPSESPRVIAASRRGGLSRVQVLCSPSCIPSLTLDLEIIPEFIVWASQ
jgi:hypothetical protein